MAGTLKMDIHRAWLRELRMSKGISMLQLAQKVGTSANYIGDIEHGRRNPSPALALALSEALGFKMELLYIGALPRQSRGKEVKAAQ